MRKLSTYLNPTLSALYEQAENIEGLQAAFRAHLPPNLQSVCLISSYKAGNLVVSVEDPIYVTPLRYSLPELRNQLRLHPLWYDLVTIQLKIQPLSGIIPKRAKPKHVLSRFTRTFLVEASRRIPYTPLSRALQALADEENP